MITSIGLTYILPSFFFFLTGLPKTTKLKPLNEEEDPSALAEPFTSGWSGAAAKEEKKKKRKPSSYLDADMRMKWMAIQILKNKRSTKSRLQILIPFSGLENISRIITSSSWIMSRLSTRRGGGNQEK